MAKKAPTASAKSYTRTPSTFDSQWNAGERRRISDTLNELLREVLVSGGRVRHAQVGVVAVVEDGRISGFQIINTRTQIAEQLLPTT